MLATVCCSTRLLSGSFNGYYSAIDFISYIIHESFDLRQQVDEIFTDISKAFDSIDNGILIYIFLID